MPRFDSIDAANKAKEQLDGADIYAGCCTLKIEYAKVAIFLFCFKSCSIRDKYNLSLINLIAHQIECA